MHPDHVPLEEIQRIVIEEDFNKDIRVYQISGRRFISADFCNDGCHEPESPQFTEVSDWDKASYDRLVNLEFTDKTVLCLRPNEIRFGKKSAYDFAFDDIDNIVMAIICDIKGWDLQAIQIWRRKGNNADEPMKPVSDSARQVHAWYLQYQQSANQ